MAGEAGQGLFLGDVVGADGKRASALRLDPDSLTTHGVIVGMTGSGKTGLGVVLIEEALRAGVGVLAIDPKGDLANLALTFPALDGPSFAPWVGAAEAEVVAARWREGLAGWGLSGEDVGALRAAADVTVYTPGSSAGVPLDVIGSLAPPPATDEEGRRAALTSVVGGLLGLAGVDADTLTNPGAALVAAVLDQAWQAGRTLDHAALVALVLDPPLRRLGVLDLDTVLPPAERRELALRLNGLLASPSAAAWLGGTPLDAAALTRGPDGRPRCAVISLSHLGDQERQTVVGVVLGRLVADMRRTSGTDQLRTLLYVDELAGFAPPVANPPSKPPLLTLLKTGRAFGVGCVLTTQNPVDLDYRLVSNAATWAIGRLSTAQDRERLLGGLATAGRADAAALDDAVAALTPRHFVLSRADGSPPLTFTTRWALSYLRGPITGPELRTLTQPVAEAAVPAAPAPMQEAEDETPVAPRVAAGVRVAVLAAAANWGAAVPLVPGGRRLEAAVAVRAHLRFDEARAGLDHREEWEAVWFPLTDPLDPAAAVPVDHDPRDLEGSAPEGARYRLPPVDLGRAALLREAAAALKAHLTRTRTLDLMRCPALKLVSRPGEDEAAFRARCADAAREAAAAEQRTLRDRYEQRVAAKQAQVATAERRLNDLDADVASRRQSELVAGAGAVLGVLLGGRGAARRAATGMRGAAGRRGQTARTAQRRESAADRLEEAEQAVEDLLAELESDLAGIESRWLTAADTIEPLAVPLEQADVDVEPPTLVWIPTAD